MELEYAENIAINYVKEKKNVKDVNVILTEKKKGDWIIKGTCPIDLAGHPWRESFEIRIDKKGKIKTSSFKLM